MVSEALRVTPAKVAVIVADLFFAGRVVLIVKVADVAPAPAVTLAGTAATAGALLFNVTTAPAAGAGADSFTVAVTRDPPTTLVRDNVSAESVAAGAAAGLTVNVVVFCTPL